MGSRYYDITLSCGCMISLDKGGGLIPCSAGLFGSEEQDPEYGVSKEECEKHDAAWQKYRESGREAENREEIERRNS